MIKDFLGLRKKNELDQLLQRAAEGKKQRFLIVWNRGLGDIALGLYALIYRIKTFIPDAQITFLAREDLRDGFCLLAGVDVIGVSWWQRKKPIDLGETLGKMKVKREDYDIILEEVNPSKWLTWQIGNLTPKLVWKEEFDDLWKRFSFFDPSLQYIAIHVSTETQKYYGYNKDWPMEKLRVLLEILCQKPKVRILLFGLQKDSFFHHPSIIDLRGRTRLLEVLSIIKNCCQALIAPDGGILSILYYLDTFFPITVISLWGDANQGIMKQLVPSPNKGLTHFPLVGKGKEVSAITVEEVLEVVNASIRCP